MASKCPNCSAELVFDPVSNKMVCEYCGSTFAPEELKISEYVNKEEPKPVSEVNGGADPEYIDSNIFTCSNCGSSIVVNGTEASTFCIYCGSPSIVFSRVQKTLRPEGLIPFKITREQAEHLIRQKIGNGFFVPSEIKRFKTDSIRGIYIPYWVMNFNVDAKTLFKATVKQGKSSHTYHYIRCYNATLNNIALDASRILNDDTSVKLEPYDCHDMVAFNENYLAGFYSDISDVPVKESVMLGIRRAHEMAVQKVRPTVRSNAEVVKSRANVTTINRPLPAMMPAWFLTFRYRNIPHTILVNGQTGKVVGSVPWNKGKFVSMFIALGVLFSIIGSLLYVFAWELGDDSDSSGKLIMFLFAMTAVGIYAGIKSIRRVMQNIKLTQSKATLKYVNKRQGD